MRRSANSGVSSSRNLTRCGRQRESVTGTPPRSSLTSSESQAFALERERWFTGLFADTLGYAGAEIIRRIVGFAHNLDFESIDNPDIRSGLERRALALRQETDRRNRKTSTLWVTSSKGLVTLP